MRGKREENIWRGTHLEAPQGISSTCTPLIEEKYNEGISIWTCDLLMRFQ